MQSISSAYDAATEVMGRRYKSACESVRSALTPGHRLDGTSASASECFRDHVHFQADSIKSPEPFRWHPAKTTTLPHQSRSDLYRHGPSPTSQMTAPHPLLDRGLHVTDRPTLTTSSQTMMLTNMSRSMSTKSASLVLNIQMWMRSHGRCLVLTKPPTIKNYRNS